MADSGHQPIRYWLAMTYGCELCGHEIEFLLEYGCEGPRNDPAVRWVPVPFMAGRCPECVAVDREMPQNPDYILPPGPPPPPHKKWPYLEHVRWSDDRTLDPMVLGPIEVPHFRYPSRAERRSYGDQACGHPIYAGHP